MGSVSNENYQLFGTKALLDRLQKLTKEIEGVRMAEDIECVHRMRVASRRMRSALRLFEKCLPDKCAKDWAKQMRGITRTLGDARDIDVQIEFLQEFLASLTEQRCRPGINRLLLRIKQRREELQKKIIKSMDQLVSSRLLDDMGQTLRHVRVHARMHHTDEYSPYIYQEAYLAISLRLEDMLAYEPYISQPDRLEELHAMRIAAKHLRYTMEVFEPLYGDDLKQSLEIARDVQTTLGDLHDCDVWVNCLPKFLEEEKARSLEYFGHTRPFSRLKAGILYLQQDRQEQRTKLYQEFVEFWKKTRDQKIWDELLERISQGFKIHLA